MVISQKAFWFFLFFIIGVGLASFEIGLFKVVLGTAFLFLIIIFLATYKKQPQAVVIGFLLCSIIIGSVYYNFYYTQTFNVEKITYGVPIDINGTVVSSPRLSEKSQGFILKTSEDWKIYVRTDKFKKIEYGFGIYFKGEIKPLEQNELYLKKDKVLGSVFFPENISVSSDQSFSFWRALYEIRDYFAGVYQKILPINEASLMTGILLGQESAQFGSDFKQAMKNSGTTHLVALSGYNITILVSSLFMFLSFLIKRKSAFWVVIIGTILFVLMTGAQSSVVRAAIMGLLAVSAGRLSRIYSFSQAAVVAGFFMVVLNPFIIRYDAGFSLSFLSLFGITYISPLIQNLTHFYKPFWQGVFQLICETIGAQLAVLPLLAGLFGTVSLIGVLSNIFLLPLVPITMAIGFIVGVVGIITLPVAKLFSLIIFIPLKIEVIIIKLFGSLNAFPVNMGAWVMVVYYGILAWILKKYNYIISTNEYKA